MHKFIGEALVPKLLGKWINITATLIKIGCMVDKTCHRIVCAKIVIRIPKVLPNDTVSLFLSINVTVYIQCLCDIGNVKDDDDGHFSRKFYGFANNYISYYHVLPQGKGKSMPSDHDNSHTY